MAATKLLARLPTGDRKHVYRHRDGRDAIVAIAKEGGRTPSYFRSTGNGFERLSLSNLPDGSLPLYNLKDIAEYEGKKSVVMVGDEKTVDLLSLVMDNPVCTWPGDLSWIRKVDHTPLQGYPLLLISDADADSRRTTRGVADFMWLNGVKRIRTVYPPFDGIDGFDGNSIADWMGECVTAKDGPDQARAGKLLRTLYDDYGVAYNPGDALLDLDVVQRYVNDTVSEENRAAQRKAISAAMEKNEHFTILGRDGGDITCQMHVSAELVKFKPDQITRSRMIQLADLQFWRELVGHNAITDDDIDEVRNSVNRVAQARGVVDLGNIRGRGAVEDRGKIYYHLGNCMLNEDGSMTPLGKVKGSKYIYVECAPLQWETPTQEWRLKAARMSNALEAFNFRERQDWLTWVGWMGSVLACGAMPWRVHLWVIGESQAGKSWLIKETANRVMGDFSEFAVDYSEAAIARLIQSDALPVILDEGEPGDKAMEKVINIVLATAHGDAKRIRSQSSSSGGVFVTTPRASIVIASTQTLVLKQAAASRIEKVHLKAPSPSTWAAMDNEIGKALDNGGAEDIRNGIVSTAKIILGNARRIEQHVMEQYSCGSRRAKIAGMVFSGVDAMGVKFNEQDLVRFIGSESKRNDNEDLLSTIMDLIVEVIDDWGETGSGETTRRIAVHEMLSACIGKTPRSRMVLSAARYGMRIRGEEDSCVMISPRMPILNKLLEQQAGVKNIDIGASLRLIDGVVDDRANFNNTQKRCLRIPEKVLNKLGYFFYTSVQAEELEHETDNPF